MGDLLDLLFSNIIIIVAVIGGIISWFNGVTKKEDDRRKKPRPEKIPNPPPGHSDQSSSHGTDNSTGEERVQEYYEKKHQRLEDLSGENHGQQASSGTNERQNKEIHNGLDGNDQMEVYVQDEENKVPVTQLNYSKKWNKQRLVEGIAMAEILGAPRSRKPHQSHPRKR